MIDTFVSYAEQREVVIIKWNWLDWMQPWVEVKLNTIPVEYQNQCQTRSTHCIPNQLINYEISKMNVHAARSIMMGQFIWVDNSEWKLFFFSTNWIWCHEIIFISNNNKNGILKKMNTVQNENIRFVASIACRWDCIWNYH